MSNGFDDLATVAVKAWTTAFKAWMEALNAIGVILLDLPEVESGSTGFNEETVVVEAQNAPTVLYPGSFKNEDGKELPFTALVVIPPKIEAGKEAEVCVRVAPPASVASGTYTGSLLDAPGGTCLVDEIGVYVVGGTAF